MLLVLKFSGLFRAVCSLFSNSPVLFQSFAPCSFFLSPLVSLERSNYLVPFQRFAPCSRILQSLSSGSLLFLKCSSIFCLVCSLFSLKILQSLSSDFLLVLKFSISFRAAPCSQILQSLSNGLLFFLFLWSGSWCSQVVQSLSSSSLMVFSSCPVPFERFAPCS